jgi:hypothetical protein
VRRPRARLALLCAAAALAFAPDAGSQGQAKGRRGIGEACASDAARHCPAESGVPLLLCLEARSAALSPACRGKVVARLGQLREHHALVSRACADEARRFCPDAPPGPGQGLVRCLREHDGELSGACRVQLSARPAR